jgi:hypothetical protein
MLKNSLHRVKVELKECISKWKDILNSHYRTDTGQSLEDYAKGKLEAYIQILTFIEEDDKKNGELEKETRRIRKEVFTNDGGSYQEGPHN